MAVPDPYRQGAPPQGGYPQQPVPMPGQPVPGYSQVPPPPPGYPQAGHPQAPYAQQPYAQPGYPTGPAPAYPYPQQPTYPTAYAQPAYPQPVYPQQPTYPQQPAAYQPPPLPAQPVAPQSPAPVDFQQQAFQAAPVRPVVAKPVVPLAPVAPATPSAPTPVPVKPVAVKPVTAQPTTKLPTATPIQPVAATTAAQPVPAAPVQPSTPQTVSARPTPVSKRPLPVTPEMMASAAATAQPVPVTPGQAAARPVLVKKAVGKETLKVEDREGDEEGEEKPPQAVKAAPPWLISLVIHMVLLIILGLMTIPYVIKDMVEIEVKYAERLGDQLEDSTILTGSSENVESLDKTFSEDMKLVDDPLAAPPELQIDPLIAGTTVTSDIAAPTIGMALTGREKGAKKALLAAYGGTKTTEEAVVAGLQWLKRNQRADGSWSLMGPFGDPAGQENVTSATAMALLAFQGNGNTHRNGDFKDVVAKGWKFLLAQQQPDGDFVKENVYNARLYTQAQCTIAICELYGMTKDPAYKKPAQLAIDFAIKAQSPEGGWRYTPRQDSDLSVTGWFVMALQSAMMAGLEVPSPNLDNITKYLDASAHSDGSQYSYKIGTAPTVPMTAEGLLCRQYLGWKHDDPRMKAGMQVFIDNPLSYEDQNVYYWYYATQAVHHMGGQDWERWNRVMREAIPRAQTKTGKEAGSWSPTQDRWGAHGGRLYVTCLSIYMLEVYYRHLPIYKHQI